MEVNENEAPQPEGQTNSAEPAPAVTPPQDQAPTSDVAATPEGAAATLAVRTREVPIDFGVVHVDGSRVEYGPRLGFVDEGATQARGRGVEPRYLTDFNQRAHVFRRFLSPTAGSAGIYSDLPDPAPLVGPN